MLQAKWRELLRNAKTSSDHSWRCSWLTNHIGKFVKSNKKVLWSILRLFLEKNEQDCFQDLFYIFVQDLVVVNISSGV